MVKIRSFTDLVAWQKGHKLVLIVYKWTARFPKREMYSLIDQMRRAVVSVTSNIAEGFSRRTSKEKIQFYHMALGSLSELQNQLIIAKDVNYLNSVTYREIANLTIEVSKLINGLVKSLST
ncbi:four helix bundle protein [Patescibacteria group bacterium]|nr:four helix bundle protein [Patescibacteria group bacterium]